MRNVRVTMHGAAAVIALAVLGCADPAKPAERPGKGQEPPPGEGRSAAKAPPAAEAEAPEEAVHLQGPSLDSWRPVFAATAQEPSEESSRIAIVTGLDVPLFPRPGARYEIGLARVGSRLPAEPASGGGCRGGSWYRVSGGAYLCSAHGATTVEAGQAASRELEAAKLARRPALDRPSPYRYAKAADGAPRLARLPTADELAALRDGKDPGRVVERWMRGAYLLALARPVEAHGEVFFETVSGLFVRERDLEPRPTPPMHGEHLGGERDLPIAFAFRDSELYCIDGDDAAPCGTVDKHARFSPLGTVERDEKALVLAGEDLAVPRDDLRLVERTDRPKGVGKSDRWLHIDLSEQALVAYEGDTPVFATLVSTGRSGFETPTGLYQVRRKYTTKTMRGRDEDGPYVVQEVPWSLYYHGNYAVHGAYWHQRFGRTRSHGCTNLPPADARWLYYWAAPTLPQGWYAMFHKRGTYVYIDGETPPDEEEDDEDRST